MSIDKEEDLYDVVLQFRKDHPEPKKRWVRVPVSYGILTEFMQGRTVEASSSLPETAKAVGGYDGYEREGVFWIVLEDESFEEAEENRLLPNIDVTFTTK